LRGWEASDTIVFIPRRKRPAMDIVTHPLPPSPDRPTPPDEQSLGFGAVFSPRMFLMDWTEGRGWHDPRIVPYGPLPLDPAAMTLHYGQAVFEGLKAYRGKDGAIVLFRPRMNFARMNRSAARLRMPAIPVEDQLEAVEALLSLDGAWVPRTRGTSLYIRPVMIATEPGLGVRPSARYLFYIITGPVGNYYARGMEPVRILVEEKYVRAARGGLGEAKTGANYAAGLLAQAMAREKGFDQVLWLDAAGLRFVEEVGTMNIFFLIGDEIVTPPLGGSILPGVTRDSALRIARDRRLPVSERPLAIEEVLAAAESASLREVFGTGTAAVVSPVGTLRYRDREFTINGGRIGETARTLYEEITGIQYGEIPDRYGWMHRVSVTTAGR
jgi:branched-chain amino acid aminotransferase